MDVTISVVIPVFNGAKFIAATIRSVLVQTNKNIEIVVVNDGSKDGTLAELEQFKDQIKIISIPNGGVSNARNVGILSSTGEYIAFMDADDLWDEHKLQVQLDAMLSAPEVGFSCCNYLVRNGEGKLVPHFDQYQDDPKITPDIPMRTSLESLIKGNFVGTCSNVMVKREVLDRAGLFDVRFRQAEDLDLWIRCAVHTDFLLMSDILLNKTTHETNLTNNYVETLQYHESVLLTLLTSDLVKPRKYLIPAIHHSLAEIRYVIGNRLFNRGQIVACFTYFWSALRSEFSGKNIVQFFRHTGLKLTRLLLETLRLRTPYRE